MVLIRVAASAQTPSSITGSSGGTSSSPPPSVLKVPSGKGVVAAALVAVSSNASTPL